ncbi:MAG: hypothetical protein ABSC21_15690 [Terriglobia bacterium]|jgi:hypothetical protein
MLIASAMVLFALPTPVFSQTAADTTSKDSNRRDDVSLLKQQIAEQQKEIEQLRTIVEQMKQKLDQSPNPAQTATTQAPNLGLVASTSPMVPKAAEKSAAGSGANLVASTLIPSAAATPSPQTQKSDPDPPLQLHIGTASITPVGFMDFTSVFRTHAAGGSIGTSFASIPYGSSVYQNNLSETRLSMQNSRIGFRVDADVKGAHVIGYMEADFLGNNPNNVAVSSNSNTMRSRLYWVDVRKGQWEVLGGQTWSLITPSRTGISPLPGDLFFCSQLIDVNYNLGLFWGRIPELRFVYHHPSNKLAFAVALDSPDQYAGGSAGGPLITLPSALNSSTAYQGELDYNQNGLNAPNVAPDVIAKFALDPSKRVHFDIGGVERNFKLYNPNNKTTYSATGGGGFLNLEVELFKGFRALTHNFWSDGGGRYIFGQAPDLIARADGSISLIHASSTVSGFEYTFKKTMIYAYYGGLYVGRNVAIDTNGKPVGYGYTGSPNGQNRAIQEPTLGFNQTIWKDAKWGAVNFMGQYSYLTRNPWYVASGQPANASLNMLFFNLRYTLPGSAPTIGH